jgi:hypothetical protein
MSSSDNDFSDSGEKNFKKICCKDCGKKFSYHQGLYTHRKSGVCKKILSTMMNSIDYIDNLKIDIEELKLCDDINIVYKLLFKNNDYNKLPFIIHDKKRKHIRFLVNKDKYVNDKDYSHFISFLNKIRYIIIRQINKTKLYSSNPDKCSDNLIFLNVILGDFDVKQILKLVLSATTAMTDDTDTE